MTTPEERFARLRAKLVERRPRLAAPEPAEDDTKARLAALEGALGAKPKKEESKTDG